MADISVSASVSPYSGKLRPDYTDNATNKIRITGSGFGSAPDVVFFDRVHGSDLELATKQRAEIGRWYSFNSSRYSVVNGRAWMTARDPLLVVSGSKNATGAVFEIPDSTELYFSARIADDPTKIMIGANSIGSPVTQVASIFKPFWFTDDDNTEGIADVVIGSWNGGDWAEVVGNTNSPVKAAGGFFGYGKNYITGSPVFRAWYQSGRESSAGAKDATMQAIQSRSDGTVIQTALGNPYGGTETITDYNYRKMYWATWFGNLTNANYANIQALAADFYCAVGPNCRARVVASNNAVLLNSTEWYDIPPNLNGWSDSVIDITSHDREHALGFYHVINGAGSIQQNVSWTEI